ncbi:NAD(P)/FAD-dependent oxidoreductase [Patescibacteria group bacterium]|nr:NAD(P)/FAD-dependent oxidoreductase [Patescibacteria group bacterium]
MKVAIVGGGLTGMVAAYRLLQNGHEVTIFEKNEQVGGLLSGFKINGTYLEKAYHHIFTTDTEILNLIEELGLSDKLQWYPDKTAVYFEHQLYSFSGPKDLLTFGAIGFADRVRTGMVGLWLQKDNNWKKYKAIPAYQWMKKWNGKAAYQVIWEPLLKGKFHNYYQHVSMAWLWARIHTRGNSNGMLGYMTGGFQQLIERLEIEIKKLGGEVKTKTFIKDFDKLKKAYDKVLMTGPVKGVTYIGAVEVIFTSKQSLSPYYWHNINDPHSPFLALIQHTNLVGTKEYKGEHVYYLGTYVPHEHHLFQAEEEKVKKEFFMYLSKIFPEFKEKEVTQSFVFKLANAQHIVTTDYQVPSYETVEKNIYQANFAQIFPEDRGTNFAVREGNKIAQIIRE